MHKVMGQGNDESRKKAVNYFYDEYIKDEEKIKEIERKFEDKGNDIWDVKALQNRN